MAKFFNCSRNNLTSLYGSPRYIWDSFNCSHNNLETLKGAPRYVRSYFGCVGNRGKKFTEDEVRENCEVIGRIEV